MKRLIPILLLVPLALFAWSAYARTPRPAGALHEVVRARPERVFTPRFSIPTEHRSCRSVRLPPDSVVPREDCGTHRDAPEAVGELTRAGALSLDADTLRGSALAAVFWWDGKEVSLDVAVTLLSEALRLGGDSVALLVDLSGVHLTRAQVTQNSQDLLVGLEHALDALELEPGNHAARFNAALALSSLARDELARNYWDLYLAADSSSSWAGEARQRRSALAPPPPLARPTTSWSLAQVNAFAARHPQEAREHGWDLVLGAWGSAVLADSAARADSLLLLAQRLGTALMYHGGDASLSDAVEAIRAAREDAGARRTLAQAHQAYALGRSLQEISDKEAAQKAFERVLRLRPRSRVLVLYTRLFHAATGASSRGPEADFSSLIAETDTVRYRALAGHARRSLATMRSLDAADHDGGGMFKVAIRMFEDVRERENLAAARYQQGWADHKHGDTLTAHGLIHQAMVALRATPRSLQQHNLLVHLSDLALDDGLERVAMLIQDEDVAATRGATNPTYAPEALLNRARVRAVSGRPQDAAADLDTVEMLVKKVVGEKNKEYFTNMLRYSRLVVTTSPGSTSMASLDTAITYFRDERRPWLLPALMRRAELRFATRDLEGAKADLDRVTAHIRSSAATRSSHESAAIMEQARSQFDKLVMMEVRRGQPLEALEAVERGRVSFAPNEDAPNDAARWVAPPPGQAVVQYALIGDTLLTWIIQRDSITLREQRIHRNDLRHTVERAGMALETRRDSVAAPHLHRLYGWLIRPVKERLGPADTSLVILADGEIAGVPFHALSDGRDGPLVLEDFSIRVATSLADAVRPIVRTTERSALLVADPKLDRATHPTLSQLGGAQAEAESLQRLYPGARMLRDSFATAAAFRASAPRASVIHYAGHAIFDDTRPERSFLVLAGKGENGRLRADAVSTMELSGVRMVVLSACRTLRAREGRSGGFAGLSGALLSAGADGVVGSLWEVDDDLTHPLLVAFHEAYRQSGDPVAALRHAQLKMLNSPDPEERSLSTWAGFRYVGR